MKPTSFFEHLGCTSDALPPLLVQIFLNLKTRPKSDDYKFNPLYVDYSPSTNVDQILHRRVRDQNGKSTYARDAEGNPILDGNKQGVPVSDVWDIPFLNPKAKERVGYPTQKPILLLERIISLASDKDDLVFDPFCGSGTTLVAASLLKRRYIGVDISSEAVDLTKQRLKHPMKTCSRLSELGRSSYDMSDKDALKHLFELPIVAVQRNNGIDALLKVGPGQEPVFIRIQRKHELLSEAAYKLIKAADGKRPARLILISTSKHDSLLLDTFDTDGIIVINSVAKELSAFFENGISQACLSEPI